MRRKGISYLIIAIVTVAILMLFQYNKPKEVNWFPSFISHHKIPYGTFVLNDLMKKWHSDRLRQINTPPFEALQHDTTLNGTYIFVNDQISFGEVELNHLLDWTAKGNTLYIASYGFEEQLLDTLHLETSNLYADLGDDQRQLHKLVHPNLSPDTTYSFEKDTFASYFSSIDTLNTVVLGSVAYSSKQNSGLQENFNVIKQVFGKGEIILCNFPKAFTNYFILKGDNRNYTAGLLSYIEGSTNVYMDNHYKSGKTFYTSPMYLFLNTKEFKWAYYLALIGALIYVVFEGKRKQRAIAVVRPLKNQTLAFTRTIADMYFEKGEQKPISDHKIAYFLEYIRTHFYLNTIDRDDTFYNNLAARSNHSLDEIKIIFTLIEKLKAAAVVDDNELKKLNTLIENFKKKTNGK